MNIWHQNQQCIDCCGSTSCSVTARPALGLAPPPDREEARAPLAQASRLQIEADPEQHGEQAQELALHEEPDQIGHDAFRALGAQRIDPAEAHDIDQQDAQQRETA